MKIVGLITEYNPFHNGHQFHITRAKEVSGADFCIALMSGSYVQRGEPAVFDKYIRTAMALQAGADLVLEMPAAFSTAPAMEFAAFGIALFTALGGVDSICFGSECGEITPLKKLAALLSSESNEFKKLLGEALRTGMTYPEARESALLGSLTTEQTLSPNEKKLLQSPNNLLGIEYLAAGLRLNSPLQFFTIRREGSGYHEEDLPKLPDGQAEPADYLSYPSASAIRRHLEHHLQSASLPSFDHNAFEALQPVIPAASLWLLRNECPVFLNDFSALLNYRILYEEWIDTADLSTELAARLKKTALSPLSFEERIKALKSRQYTYTRVSRALMHLVLDIRSEQRDDWKAEGYALYARILGFRQASSPLLSHLKKNSAIPLITKTADAKKLLSTSALSMLEQEIRAAHLYQMVKSEKGGDFRNEYQQGIIII